MGKYKMRAGNEEATSGGRNAQMGKGSDGG